MVSVSIKKVISVSIAAVICAVTALSVPAAAKTSDTVWKDTKTFAGASYSSKYIKLAETYGEKKASKTVTYSKSRTKKFLDKYAKNTGSDNPQFAINVTDNKTVISLTIKGEKYKAAVYDSDDGMAYCGDLKNITFLDINNKKKCSMATDEALKLTGLSFPDGFDIPTALAIEASNMLDFDIDDGEKGKYFKFTSDEKTYYYEEFEYGRYGEIAGFLFNKSGSVIAANIDGDTVCLSVSYKIADSAFDIPKGYKNTGIENIGWLN